MRVLVLFCCFLSLLYRRGGDKIYTPNLSPSLLRDSTKRFSWASAKDLHMCFVLQASSGAGSGSGAQREHPRT